jgi:hypothetical protein
MTTQLTNPQEQIANLQQDVARLQQELANQNNIQQQQVEFYAASVNAWYNTALEFDKSMFTLSAGGIGLLVTMMSDVKSMAMLHLYVAAVFFFIVCICMLLFVFRKNMGYIMQIANEQPTDNSLLRALDTGAAIMFSIGVVLTVVVGVMAAMQKLDVKP